jgi:sigma54-dependent transcription regulator
MTSEVWRECRHHHHGCACREHTWEERVAGLEAEVSRLSNLADHLEEESGQRDCAALEAEVARLQATCATERQTAISLCIEVISKYRGRFDRRSEFRAFDILSSAESMLENLIRDQLPTHTWQQERAAVVGWLRDSADPRDSAVSLSYDIAGGEHWPEGGAL